jgi:hypothetical protein
VAQKEAMQVRVAAAKWAAVQARQAAETAEARALGDIRALALSPSRYYELTQYFVLGAFKYSFCLRYGALKLGYSACTVPCSLK